MFAIGVVVRAAVFFALLSVLAPVGIVFTAVFRAFVSVFAVVLTIRAAVVVLVNALSVAFLFVGVAAELAGWDTGLCLFTALFVIISVTAAVFNALSSLVLAVEFRLVTAVVVLRDALSLALLLVVVTAEMVGGGLAWVGEVLTADVVLVLAAAFGWEVSVRVGNDGVELAAVWFVFSEVFQIGGISITAVLSMAAKFRELVFFVVGSVAEAEVVVGSAFVFTIGLVFSAAPVVAVEDFIFTSGVVVV